MLRPFPARLVQNNTVQNHLIEIQHLLPQTQELWIAVAFISEKGVNLLLESIQKHAPNNLKVRIFTSTERAVSEPKALYLLWQKSITTPHFELFLINKQDAAAFFHSKIYYFINTQTSNIMLGSANLTQGGLLDNSETSLVFEEAIASRLDTQIADLFQGLRPISTRAIAENITKYSDFYAKEQGLAVSFEMTDERKSFIFNQYFKNKTFENPRLRILKQNLTTWLDNAENAPIPSDVLAFFEWLQPAHHTIVRFIQHHQALATATLWRAVCHENTQQNTLLSTAELSALLHLYQPRRFVPITEAFFLFLRYECDLQTGLYCNINPETYTACCHSISALRQAWHLKSNGDIITGLHIGHTDAF
jgi:HKD family nuclease